jgi:hypothetical protein
MMKIYPVIKPIVRVLSRLKKHPDPKLHRVLIMLPQLSHDKRTRSLGAYCDWHEDAPHNLIMKVGNWKHKKVIDTHLDAFIKGVPRENSRHVDTLKELLEVSSGVKLPYSLKKNNISVEWKFFINTKNYSIYRSRKTE